MSTNKPGRFSKSAHAAEEHRKAIERAMTPAEREAQRQRMAALTAIFQQRRKPADE
jgi:hypothetical protein